MQADLVNIGLAFIEGLLLIFSPCILPILPIILSGSLTGSKSRPLGIIAGFIITFTLFTLFSRSLIQLTHLNENSIRTISFGILLLLGLVMLSDTLTGKFTLLTQRLTRVGSGLQTANNPESGVWGGLIFGGLIGIIWTPCAGPILAAVIVQVVIQKTTWNSVLVVLAFAIGTGIPMLLIALFGRKIMLNVDFLRDRTILLRRLLGLIIILAVCYLIFFPGGAFSFNQSSQMTTSTPASLVNGLEHHYPAPAIQDIDAWINSPPLNWNDLKGKVVLVDFWTYSCVNCIRTLPYLREWYAKYRDRGFEIIGVHSPEFQFEHDVNNVREAVTDDQIMYPVALDNHFTTWQNFGNQYWPAHYLVNRQGEVVYVHFGEGEYDVTENNIRYLLGMGAMNSVNREEAYAFNLTPETYLGYARAERFSSPETMKEDISANYTFPADLAADDWALSGNWIISAEKIVSTSPDAAVRLHFNAGKVYMVMGVSGKKNVTAKVLLNGKPIENDKGSDVEDSLVQVNHNQLYSLVKLTKGSEGMLEVIADKPGLEVYTFTFGS